MSQVWVSWLHPGEVSSAFAESLTGLVAWDSFRRDEGLPRQVTGMAGKPAGVNVSTPRNEAVRDFLAHPERGPWHLSIDVDMAFPPDAVEQLLDHADPDMAPIVGGLCFGADENGLFPTLYELVELDEGPCFVRYTQFPMAKPLLRVAGTGAGFLLVHRRVYEAIETRRFSRAYPWFQETELSAGPVGEDLTFMLRAGICGFPVHVLTSLHIGHIKPTMLNAYRYFKQEGRIVEPPSPTAPPVGSDTAVRPWAPIEGPVPTTSTPGAVDPERLAREMGALLAHDAQTPSITMPEPEEVLAHA